MRKNPYLKAQIAPNLDARTEAIIKKAKRFGVELYENPILAKKLLELSDEELDDEAIKLFLWILEQEKTVQMSSE